MADFQHRTVFRDAVVAALQPCPGGRYLDGTLGGGGHAEALLLASEPDGLVVGIDRDPAALAAAGERLDPFGDRAVLLHGRFGDMGSLAAQHGPFDGVVLDIGVSSPQLDQAERGFSFQRDGPLDMRMDTSSGPTASEWLDEITEFELVGVLRDFGEEPRAPRIARAIIAGRPWHSTLPLARAVEKASGYRNSRKHPATRTFQAIRVALNDELGELERGLHAALRLLAPGGRMAVITFQSLEDRIVKSAFREAAGKNTPRDAYGNLVRPAWGRIVGKHLNGAKHDADNPRARSARLRTFERTAPLGETHVSA